MSRNKLTPEQVQSIPNMLEQMNQRALAQYWNVTLGAISYWVRKYKNQGIELNKWNKGIILQSHDPKIKTTRIEETA